MNFITRPTFVVAALSVVASLLFALLLQLGLLGALGIAATARDVTLTPTNNVQAVKSDKTSETDALQYDTSRGQAVAQARAIQIAAKDVLAVTLRTSDVTANVRGILGWLSTRDLTRPATVTIPLAGGVEQRKTTVLLVGHPNWRGTLTHIGLGLESPPGQGGGALLREFDLTPASPIGATQLLASAWFGHDVTFAKPVNSANRLLPLALWFVIAAALSIVVIALVYRRVPEQRAAALKSGVAMLGVLAVALTLAGNLWPGGSLAVLAAVAAIAALWLIEPLPQLPVTQGKRWLIAAVLAALCAALSPWVAAIACIPALLLMAAHWRPALSSAVATALLAAPVLLLCAVAQKMLSGPQLPATLADPTSSLAMIATSSAGLPGFTAGLLAAHFFWPAPAQVPRWSAAGGAAAAWALAGAMLVLTVPGIAALVADRATLVALFLPFLACLMLAVRPKFQQVAASFTETESVQPLTEEDLSVQALGLLESYAERVINTLRDGQTGAARLALAQMLKIAPAARATQLADLRILLATGDLANAQRTAGVLAEKADLTAPEADALLELAHRQHDPSRVVELADRMSPSEPNTRALAMARLQLGDPQRAITTLSAWPNPDTFAREIAELHLAGNDVAGAQLAMVNTGIALTSALGEAYVSRLGLCAQGPALHSKAISHLAIWQPQLGAAQAAMGELLLAQGKLEGARARLLLALKLDPALWPLQLRLARIDALQTAAVALQPASAT